jgi:hypothetical protein
MDKERLDLKEFTEYTRLKVKFDRLMEIAEELLSMLRDSPSRILERIEVIKEEIKKNNEIEDNVL